MLQLNQVGMVFAINAYMKARIVIVEDDAALRESMESFLESEGYGVESAGSAEEALGLVQRLRSDQKKIDLMVLDQALPKMNGLELARKLYDRSSLAPYIMVSGTAGPEVKHLAKQFGCLGCFSKPISVEQILKVMQDVLKKQKKIAHRVRII